MSTALSVSSINRLGEALRKGQATREHVETLVRWRAGHIPVLVRALSFVRDARSPNDACSARLKNASTIREKLVREKTRLARMQDIAGVRIVMFDNDRARQDAVVERISTLLEPIADQVTVKDRRAEPTHGYRACHVLLKTKSRSVEVQIRTDLQHRWAECFERFADFLGRGIRYGQPPSHVVPMKIEGAEVSPNEIISQLKQLSDSIAEAEVMRNLDYRDVAEELKPFEALLKSFQRPTVLASDLESEPHEWRLIRYDRQEGTHELVRELEAEDSVVAQWLELEQQHDVDDRYENVVLLGRLEDIIRTHSRYFSRHAGPAPD
ncbi:MAG: RelA/SpoT domain-containing protein [Myxococcota bacterium]